MEDLLGLLVLLTSGTLFIDKKLVLTSVNGMCSVSHSGLNEVK